MDITQLREELTKRGIPFASNLGVVKLQALLDAAPAAENDGNSGAPANPPESGDVGKPPAGEVKAAVPAAAASTAPVEVESNAIPDLEIIAKMGAGLTREQAVEVITAQRAHDKTIGI
jgi:hypothetical protein